MVGYQFPPDLSSDFPRGSESRTVQLTSVIHTAHMYVAAGSARPPRHVRVVHFYNIGQICDKMVTKYERAFDFRPAGGVLTHPIPPRPPAPANSGLGRPRRAAIDPFPQPSPKNGQRAPAQECHSLAAANKRDLGLPARRRHRRHRQRENACRRAH